MKTLMIGTAALLLAGAAFAQSASFETNAEGMIERDQFRAGMGENPFGDWDTDGDGVLSRAEYEAGVAAQDEADTYGSWDDRFGEWERAEEDRLTADEYIDRLWGAFDADHDDMWNEEESAAWEEDEMRYDATRSGREISTPSGDDGEAGAAGGDGGPGGTGSATN